MIKSGLICEPDAAHIKSVVVNHCYNLIRKVNTLLHSFHGYGLMTLDLYGNNRRGNFKYFLRDRVLETCRYSIRRMFFLGFF